jgi:hypothetical protein
MSGVEEQPESAGSGVTHDVAIAEVQAKQFGVVARCERHLASCATAARADDARGGRDLGLVARPAPVADGGAGDARAAGDFAVVEAGADELEGVLADDGRVHADMLPHATLPVGRVL